MRRLALLVLLAACARPADPLPPSVPVRNPAAPVASQANASLARFAGDWVVVEGAGLRPGARLRIDNGLMTVDGRPQPLSDEGTGRFRLSGDPLWVHWLDADNRTAALGSPNGGRVWIMDRNGAPGERLRAAHEILTWYGYDLSQLER
ncbi:Lipocalin family protein [Citreicella sp. 357]|nr:Lipocalin family protein [Citreicella sp. 357]